MANPWSNISLVVEFREPVSAIGSVSESGFAASPHQRLVKDICKITLGPYKIHPRRNLLISACSKLILMDTKIG